MISRKQVVILSLYIILINFVYFISAAYINCTNDGSHFALVSALVEKRSVSIEEYIDYTKKVDYATKDGGYYSDRVPGNALVTIPFFMLAKLMRYLKVDKLLTDHEKIEEVFVIFQPNISATLGLVLLFLVFLYFKFDFITSMVALIIYSLGTLHWMEATHLFSHALSLVTTLAAVYLALKMESIEKDDKLFLLMVFFLTLSSIVEIQNILFFGPFCYYFFKSKKLTLGDLRKRKSVNYLIYAFVIFIFVYSILLIYNYAAFHEIMIKNSKYNPTFPFERSFITSLSGNVFKGLRSLFITSTGLKVIYDWSGGTGNYTPGVFMVSPILILSLWGFRRFFRYYRIEAIFFVQLIVINVLIAAFHMSVWVRYITTILPLFYFPVIYIIRESIDKARDKNLPFWKRYWLVSIVTGCSLIGVARTFYSVDNYYGHESFGIFPFRSEILSYFTFYLIVSIVVALIYLIRRSLRKGTGDEATVLPG